MQVTSASQKQNENRPLTLVGLNFPDFPIQNIGQVPEK